MNDEHEVYIEKIKPCPFCGNDDYDQLSAVGVGDNLDLAVMCEKCGALGPIAPFADSAIYRWNHAKCRSEDAGVDNLNECE